MCQSMPTGLYTRCDFHADLQLSRPVRTNLEVSKKRSCRTFNEPDRTAELKDLDNMNSDKY